MLVVCVASCAAPNTGTTQRPAPWRQLQHVDAALLANILEEVLPPACSLVRRGTDERPIPDFVAEHAGFDASRNAVRWCGSAVTIAEADALIARLDVPGMFGFER